MPFSQNAPDGVRVALGLAAQEKKCGGDAVFCQHIQQLRRIDGRPVVKGDGAQIFPHGLAHDDSAVHHPGGGRLSGQRQQAATGCDADIFQKRLHTSLGKKHGTGQNPSWGQV